MDTINALVIGDPHFMVTNIEEVEELVKKILLIVEHNNYDFVVVLGDILHTHEKIHVTPFKMAIRFLRLLSKKVHTFLIIGNHDYINNQQFLTDNHAFNSLKKWDNMTVCDKVRIKQIKGHKFVFCPYVPPDRFIEALDTLIQKGKNWDDATCIFAHQEFYGCLLNPVMKSEQGDTWPEDYPLVISGHIHQEQRLQSNIYYPGSCMQHSFGEHGTKTIAHVTFNSPTDFKINKIDLEMKHKKIIYLDIDKVDDFFPKPNEIIKLVLRGTSQQFKLFRRCNKYKELIKRNVRIVFVPSKILSDDDTQTVRKQNVLDILKDLIKEDDEYVQEGFQQLVYLK